MPSMSSHMVALGTKAAPFELKDTVSGTTVSLQELKSDKATVIMFICNHCPYVKHVQAQLVQLANDYIPQGVSFIAINSNDAVAYPDDSPEKMKEEAVKHQYPFVYLFDETQETARAYEAACTPDFFIYDNELKLAYRGQLDGSRPSNDIPVTGQDVRNALDHLLAGKPVPADQKPSMGCGIKWKP